MHSKINKQKKYLAIVITTSTVFALLLCEIILRAIGFSYRLYPTKVEFGFPDPVELSTKFNVDRDLFWVPKNYAGKLAKMKSNPPSIIFMGDSCTQFGIYPETLQRIVTLEFPGNRLNYAQVGVVGWSSYQGLEQLKRDIVQLKPKIITIYFGWNDHWMSFGLPDKDVRKINESLLYKLNSLRIVQLIDKVRVVLFVSTDTRPLRVSLEDYRGNLTSMVNIARENGIIPLLLTAPSAHIKGKEPEFLAERWMENLSDLIPLHNRYNSVVREVARDNSVVLIDLAKYFDQYPKELIQNNYFEKDGIHPNVEGNRVIAEILYTYLFKNNLIRHSVK